MYYYDQFEEVLCYTLLEGREIIEEEYFDEAEDYIKLNGE